MEKSKEKLSLFWLARYRPYPMVALSGVLLILSFPPSPLAFLAYVAFIPLLLVIDVTPGKTFEDRFWGFFKAIFVVMFRMLSLQFIWRYKEEPWIYRRKIISQQAEVFRYAYTAFIIWNLGTCYWLMLTAVGTYQSGGDIGAVIGVMIAGLMANILNPFLMTIPIYFYTKVKQYTNQLISGLSLVLFWVSFEWLHFNWELSWSWVTIGHSQSMYPSLLQYIEFTGILGTSFQIILVNVMLFLLIQAFQKQQKKQGFVYGGIALLALVIPIIANIFIVDEKREVFQSYSTLNVRVTQPSFDPYLRYGGITREEQIAVIDSLIKDTGVDTIDLAIMPETAIPKGIFTECIESNSLIRPFWATVRRDSVDVLAGLTQYRYYPKDTNPLPASAREYQSRYNRYFDACKPFRDGYFDSNNAAALMRADTLTQFYQKAKLVPMVERVPYIDKLAFLKNFHIELGGNFGNYGLPDSLQNHRLSNGHTITPLICYESEYGGHVAEFVNNGSDLLTVITNDGWWQQSSGHIQHLHFSSLRAIETRREVARSANTGISAFIDAKGNIMERTAWWERVKIDRKLKLYKSKTFYVKYGDLIAYFSMIISALLIGFVIFKSVQKRFTSPQSH
jgi:apolipoprotein N-acyltransferase